MSPPVRSFNLHDVEYEATHRFSLVNIFWKHIVFSATEKELTPLMIIYAIRSQMTPQWIHTCVRTVNENQDVFLLISLREKRKPGSIVFTSALLRVSLLSCQVFLAWTSTASKASMCLLSHLINSVFWEIGGDDRYLRSAEFVQPHIIDIPGTLQQHPPTVDNNLFLITVITYFTTIAFGKKTHHPVFNYSVTKAQQIASLLDTHGESMTLNILHCQEQALFDGFARYTLEKSVYHVDDDTTTTTLQCSWADRYIQNDFWTHRLRLLPYAPDVYGSAPNILILVEQKDKDDISYMPWQEQQWHGWLLLQWILHRREVRQKPHSHIFLMYVYHGPQKEDKMISIPCLHTTISIRQKALTSITVGTDFWTSVSPSQIHIPDVIISDVNQRKLWKARDADHFLFFQYLQKLNTIIFRRL